MKDADIQHPAAGLPRADMGEPGLFSQPRIDGWLAGLVTLFGFTIYLLTVQPTLSFWDCGEFIACAAILGVPHPPGTPLFILIGRLFSILPAPADIGLRVNLVSVVFGALAMGMAYLIVTRLVRRFIFKGLSFWGDQWIYFTAGFCGAGLLGFGNTVWANSIEAEVYGITLFLFLVVIYTTLVWIDQRETALGPRLLIFATFVAVLGLGVHMMVFIAMPGFWLAVFLIHRPYLRDWRIWLVALASGAIMVTGTEAFLWNLTLLAGLSAWHVVGAGQRMRWLNRFVVPVWAILLYSLFQWLLPLRADTSAANITSTGIMAFIDSFGWGTFDWILSLAILATAFVGSLVDTEDSECRPGWSIALAVSSVALVAFSLQVFTPIRSAQDPRIDENNPETWEAFKGFLERKQYGRQSMVSRMFKRRGDWENQLGRHSRMGFWSFFETQYGIKSGALDRLRPERGMHPPAFLLLVLLGLFGVGYLMAVYWRVGVPLFLTLFLATIGLVVYMNFADGTHYNPNVGDQAYLEVRDRDYFFTTGFALFGIFVALGVGSFLRVFLDPGKRMWKPVVIVSSAVFIFALPIKTITANYWQNDRSRDFIPYDYARNLLISCEPNAILFTNGDNDTFPLWCLQEAYGIRKDVRVVNLSLSNTHWYVAQLKETLKVPFDMPAEEIPLLRPNRRDGRIQDQVINTILESNDWELPVYFGSSAPKSSRRYRGASLDSNLRMEGLVMHLVRTPGLQLVDRELTMDRCRNQYQYRAVNDSTVFKNETTLRIVDNYATGILFVADSYRREGHIDSAVSAAAFAARLRPQLEQPRAYIVQLAGEHGLKETYDSLVQASVPKLHPMLHYNYALSAELSGHKEFALSGYQNALASNPGHGQAFRRVAALLYEARDYSSLLPIIDGWIAANPNDSVGPILRREVEVLMALPKDSNRTPGGS